LTYCMAELQHALTLRSKGQRSNPNSNPHLGFRLALMGTRRGSACWHAWLHISPVMWEMNTTSTTIDYVNGYFGAKVLDW